MSTTAAKDILRVNFGRLVRFWVRDRPDPSESPGWVELGHLFAGFDYKLARIREIDGLKRENATGSGFEAQGTFQFAQNEIVDYQTMDRLLSGPLSVAMLVGRPLWPAEGKLVVHDWSGNAKDGWDDRRIALVGDPGYTGSILTQTGTISGYISGFEMYQVTNLLDHNGAISFTTLSSLNPFSAIGGPVSNLGS
jgi:hypothetical protein